MRTLKRPMFKKGGSANEGIMDGLVDRRGYDLGGLTREQYQKFQSLEPIDLRQEWEKPLTAEGLQEQGTYTHPFAGQHGFDVASPDQVSDIEWFGLADPEQKTTEFEAWKKGEGKDLVAKQKEYEELLALSKGDIPEKPEIEIKKTTNGGLSDTNRISQKLLKEKQDTLSDKAKKYAEILSPGARKRAIFDSLAAASESFGQSTGDTKQDIANAISAAAKASGGAKDVLDKARFLALQEEIQMNIEGSKEKKPNLIDSQIEFLRGVKDSDGKRVYSESDIGNIITKQGENTYEDLYSKFQSKDEASRRWAVLNHQDIKGTFSAADAKKLKIEDLADGVYYIGIGENGDRFFKVVGGKIDDKFSRRGVR